MALETRNGKIVVSQRDMNRLFYGTKKPWEVLRGEGAQILVKGANGAPEILGEDEQPYADVIGVDLLEQRERHLLNWKLRFVESIPTTGEKRRIKECRIDGRLTLVARDGIR